MKSFINTRPPPPRLIARLAGNGRGLGFWWQGLSLNLSLLVGGGRSGQSLSWNVSRCVSCCPASPSVVVRPPPGDDGRRFVPAYGASVMRPPVCRSDPRARTQQEHRKQTEGAYAASKEAGSSWGRRCIPSSRGRGVTEAPARWQCAVASSTARTPASRWPRSSWMGRGGGSTLQVRSFRPPMRGADGPQPPLPLP